MKLRERDPDDVLVRKLQSGDLDRDNWRGFVERIRRWIVFRFPALYSHADDLAGEAALAVFESIHSFRGEARFIRWVQRIAYFVVCRFLNRQPHPDVSFEDVGEEAASDDAIEKLMLQLAAEAAMQSLTEQERIVFLLRVEADTDHQEIARRLGITGNASRQTWMRAAEKIGRYRREMCW